MSELQIVLCGGTGINIGKDLLAMPGTKIIKEASYLALDTSDSNPTDNMFPLEHMNSTRAPGEKAQGSGKDITLNYEHMSPFIGETFRKHKPGKFVIVIGSGAGGSGSGLTLATMRYLISKGVPVVLVLVSDFSSLVERRNSVKVLQSYANQTQQRYLGKVIPFIRVNNTSDKTWGEVNKEAVNEINYLSLFLTESNEGLDFEDIVNLLQYSKVTGLPPALSEINFFNEKYLADFTGKPPVAYCSLHDSRENVKTIFEGAGYRATGIINLENNPPSDSTIVLTLDHGEAVEKVKHELDELEKSSQNSRSTFVKQDDFSDDANEDGSCF